MRFSNRKLWAELLIVSMMLLSITFLPRITTEEAKTLNPTAAEANPVPMADPTIQQMIAKVSKQNIYSMNYDLQNFTTRFDYTDPNLNNSAQYVRDKFALNSNLTIYYDPFMYGGWKLKNVIGVLPGLNRTNSSLYVMGGHFDSYSDNDPYTLAPGADDDGSGTVAVIEAARIMSKYQFEATIYFGAWAAEEVGLVGSSHFAANASNLGWHIPAYLNFDMIGNDPGSSMGLSIGDNAQSHWLQQYMDNNNVDYSIGLVTSDVAGSGSSDHASFWASGYDAVECAETDFSPNWHKDTDTVSNMNFDLVHKTTKLAVASLAGLAGVKTPGKGAIYLNKSQYMLNDVVEITVYDTDLDTDPGSPQTTSVNIKSTTETTAEQVQLTETGPNTGIFKGTIQTAPGSPGPDSILQVSNGDVITAEYAETNPSGIRKAQATVDGIPPTIRNVAVTPDVGSAVVTWETDEPCDSTVDYGTTTSLGKTESAWQRVTAHSIELTNLTPDTFYYFDVVSSDAAGNKVVANNGGSHYGFKTLIGVWSIPDYGYVGYVKASAPNSNFFKASEMLVGRGQQGIYQGAGQFQIPTVPNGATLLNATMKVYGKEWVYTGSAGQWNLRMLPSTIDSNWPTRTYNDVHNAVPEDTIPPTFSDPNLDPGLWNTFYYSSPQQFALLQNHINNGKISYRWDGPTSGTHLFSWDTGQGGESYAHKYSPRLTIRYSLTGDNTGPTSSSIQFVPNPTNGAKFVNITASISDAGSGNTNVAAAEWFRLPDPGPGKGNPLGAQDGAFDSPTETAEGLIDVSSWATGSYTIYVRGMDASGNWGSANSGSLYVSPPSPAQYYEVQFTTLGWHFISIPLLPLSTNLPSVLGSIDGKYSAVQWFDASSADHWKEFVAGRPLYMNDLTTITNLIGFWINITNVPCTLNVSGYYPPAPTAISLVQGWNMVGYPSQSTVDVATAFTGAPSGYRVMGFDASATYRLKTLAGTDQLAKGMGLWVYMPSAWTWNVNP